jgi:plastocyanin
LKRLTLLAAALASAAALTTAAVSGAQTSALPTLTLSLTGTAITVGGNVQSGAVNITSTSTAKEAEPTIVRLNPGVTADQLLAAVAHIQDPNDVAAYGSIVFDADAPRGTTSAQTLLTPGDYLALDTQGDNPTKWPHAAFTVTAAAQPAALPAANATVRAMEFGFRSPKTLHVGQVVRFQNDGYLVHMIDAVKVRNTRDAKRVTALLRAGKDSKAEKLAVGFASFMGPASHGAVQQLKLNAKPGIYVFACFMATQDHREHVQLGMLKTVRIAK